MPSIKFDTAKEWFKKHQYNHLILIFESEKEYHLAIFWGGQPYPHAIKTFKKNSSKVIELNIAQSFFNGETQRLMSKKERETQVQNADPYYSQKIIYDTYLTFSVENTYAISDHSDASVRNYRFNNSPDSSSQYDWTNEASTTFQFSAGKGYNGMFYGGLFGAYSEFEVKYDSTHLNITDWSYQRIDVGLEAYLGKTYALGESFDLYPYVYLRFMYTWMIESFEQSNSPADADLRVTLPTVKGGSAGIGTRLLFNGTHGIDFNMGISHRGQVAKEAFNPDPQETIGGTTNEVWLGMKYWLNFRYLE